MGILMVSCEKEKTDSEIVSPNITNNNEITTEPEVDFYYKHYCENYYFKGRSYVCTGYIIKNGERHELQRITFQYLGDACDHIQACIDEFPDITWVVYINDNDWNRVCASV